MTAFSRLGMGVPSEPVCLGNRARPPPVVVNVPTIRK